MSNYETPLKADAFKMTDQEKIKKIEHHFKEIMEILGLDLNDDSLNGTPGRIAKMYVKEIFSGLNPANKPEMSLLENKFNYQNMIVEKDITVHSNCEHHFVPFFGKAHVAYFAKGKVLGLSKINRLVHYYCKRPQLQERLTLQIANEIKNVAKIMKMLFIIWFNIRASFQMFMQNEEIISQIIKVRDGDFREHIVSK